MKRLSTLMLGAALALAMNAQAQTPEDVASAQRVAEAWLSKSDAGQYGQTWDEAAPVFQGAISKPKWEEAIRAVRGPLGTLGKRTLQDAAYSTTLPGAPAGEYVVIRYATDFANKAGTTETITPMRTPDGKWRVSGYFIH